ncbi:MAG: DUF1080 domain-containing protein [Bacteroidota bacterium]
MFIVRKIFVHFSLSSLLSASFLVSSAACMASNSSDGQEDFSNAFFGRVIPAQSEPGPWKILFGGKNTDAWRGFHKETMPSGWKVDNGTLTLGEKGAGDIITKDEYENYELELEWKISEGGNSGIIYNVVEDPKYKNTYETGPEMQVLDNDRHPDAKLGKNSNRTAGSNYDLISPAKPAKPAGAWNKARLVVNKGHVEHWLNGVKVVEYQLWSPEWEELVKNSKFTAFPDYGKAKKGHIALQDHGDKVWYRNIRIRTLSN